MQPSTARPVQLARRLDTYLKKMLRADFSSSMVTGHASSFPLPPSTLIHYWLSIVAARPFCCQQDVINQNFGGPAQ